MRSTQRFACHHRLLHECINAKDLVAGRPAHSLIISENLETVALLGGLLIRLFGLCGSLLEANLAFSKLPNPDVITWHAIISAHEIHGEYGRALELYQRMQQEGTKPDRFIFTCVLKACGSIQNLEQGMRVHEQIAKVGIDSDVVVGSTLVDMYAKCDCMEKAHEVFENLRSRNVVTWGAIIDGSVQHGHGLVALELFAKMLEEGIEPNKVIFLSILKACGSLGDLGQGKLTHDQILRSRLELEIAVQSTLIDMYAKCGSLNEAENLFKKLPNQDVVSCGAMISGYIQHGRSLCALKFFARMQHEGVHSNKTILTCILKACGSIKALEQGRVVHDNVTKQGVESDVVVGSALVDMYAKCECLDEACEVFEHMPRRNSVSWGAMIAGYAQHDYGLLALEFFERMQKDGIVPSIVTFLCTVKACVTLGSLLHGRLIHTQMLGSGLELDVATGSALVDMYAKCGSIKDASKLFDKLSERNVVSWCAMIWGYAEHGQGLAALEHFEKMQEEGLKPNKATFLSALKACECLEIVYHGRLIHERIIKSGLELDMIIGSALVDMYARYGSLAESRKVFDGLPKRDVVAWGAMIAGYAQHNGGQSAIELFEKMQLEGLKLDKTMTSSILKACTGLGAVVQGMVIHHQTIQDGFDLDCVVRNSLVDMYAKCGSVQDAEKLFIGFSTCDVVSWGAMIGAYAQHGLCLPALELFENMQLEGIQPNNAIFQSILKACGSMGAIQQGRQIHEQIIRSGFDSDEAVSNALIDMYVKCGSLEQAYKLFNNMRMPGVMSWGALIVGCVQHGFALPALHLYGRMREQGIEGNKVILPCIVKACGITGATGQGMHVHDYVIRTGLEFDVVIGSTLVGMYSKGGKLDEARKVLDSLQNRDVMSWSAIIAGYVDHGEFKLAKQCLEEMQHDGMQPHCVTYTSILAACTHAGNVEECHQYYLDMREEHAISPTVEHLNCMINLLGDAGYLNEAEQLLHTMPISSNIVGWTTLLGACNKYGSKGLGRQCFDQVVLQDRNMASSYVLMSNIYSDVHNEQEIR